MIHSKNPQGRLFVASATKTGDTFWYLFAFVITSENNAVAIGHNQGVPPFISAVFFYLYNQTIQKMSSYHNKLVLSQNINLALKLVQDIPEGERVEPLKNLIDRLTTDINKKTNES